ncbi:MAG: glycosyltransferase family 2 protein [Verrucomicrobia bacterium]|nr:glycosyltransferase family 2 protein [Verrucomicrobiota bacterium]
MKISVLLTVHNRIDKTLTCLESLFAQECNAKLKVFLVDDGSTDNTIPILTDRFPQVAIIPGDGSLYWNQGMRLAWSVAAKETCDAFLWLNNDTLLLPGALATLLTCLQKQMHQHGKPGIVVAACRSSSSSDLQPETTYGGRNHQGLLKPEDSDHTPIAFMNGNCVLVSREVYDALGNLSDAYQHAWGDFDYGMHANRAGFPVWLAPGHLAVCDANGARPHRNINKSLSQRINAFRSPTGVNFRELLTMQRLTGRGNIVWSFLKQWFLVFFPRFGCSYE